MSDPEYQDHHSHRADQAYTDWIHQRQQVDIPDVSQAVLLRIQRATSSELEHEDEHDAQLVATANVDVSNRNANRWPQVLAQGVAIVSAAVLGILQLGQLLFTSSAY